MKIPKPISTEKYSDLHKVTKNITGTRAKTQASDISTLHLQSVCKVKGCPAFLDIM